MFSSQTLFRNFSTLKMFTLIKISPPINLISCLYFLSSFCREQSESSELLNSGMARGQFAWFGHAWELCGLFIIFYVMDKNCFQFLYSVLPVSLRTESTFWILVIYETLTFFYYMAIAFYGILVQLGFMLSVDEFMRNAMKRLR